MILIRRVCLFFLACVLQAQSISLKQTAQTFSRAQATAWVQPDRLAVARWDGTLTVFRPPAPGEYGPVLTQAVVAPTLQPIETIIRVSPGSFITSNGDRSIAFWKEKNGNFTLASSASYDAGVGVAESGSVVSVSKETLVVSGHSEGFVLIWRIDGDHLRLVRKVSMRSQNPIPSNLWNVRAIVSWGDGKIITGSEDGDLVLFDVLTGKEIARMRYSTNAQRGINSLSLSGDFLLLANCSVGSSDKNLWLYRVEQNRIVPLDATNLVKDTTRPQVFDFSTEVVRLDGSVYFLASTEEGLVWLGRLNNDKIETLSSVKVTDTGGAALAAEPGSDVVSAVAYDVDLLSLLNGGSAAIQKNR